MKKALFMLIALVLIALVLIIQWVKHSSRIVFRALGLKLALAEKNSTGVSAVSAAFSISAHSLAFSTKRLKVKEIPLLKLFLRSWSFAVSCFQVWHKIFLQCINIQSQPQKRKSEKHSRKSIHRGSDGPPKDNRKQIIRMLGENDQVWTYFSLKVGT